MRLIDADTLLSDRMKTKFYHLPNGDVAIPLIDVEHAPTVGGWISVKDRLPPNAEHLGSFCPRYLVKTEFGVTEGWYNPDRGNWFVLLWSMLGRFDLRDIDIERGDRPGVSARVAVTHWMPFPEPPEEVQDESDH